MYQRTVEYVLVVLLVVTAGCVGGLADAAADAASDDGGDGDGGAGGGGGDGGGGDDTIVENRTAVLVEAGSYTSTWRMRATEGDTVVGETVYTTAIDYDARRSLFGSTQTSDGETTGGYEMYVADGVAYARYGEGEAARVTTSERAFRGSSPFESTSYVAFGDELENFDRRGTETFDGVTVTRYVMTERPAWLAGQAMSDDEVRWAEFTFEVLVDEDGLVRLERWEASGVDDAGVTHTIEFRYEITGVGSTTVDEPDWAAAARDESGESGESGK